ncbi:hypothetical protein PC129_g16886 [Phytophthora cactorum]|uniref:Uncharacterized protein n=1 Tax=Phytophthora cactorum TaxID=29920 RepID=A0A8T1HLK5_9STRA|nr:hypothetical protein Pcac1_g17209 [Phytophthora cactorum]KAG2888935.1 hypothetical protein PC114_g18178 [Phytophthora cactorum]KAG2967873.1 hypothetical protein PC119_g24359 [Phytophthora cactorum]KAG3127523.1 hypothetical protein C6341_g24946 [Phytophthora cactorum]KAG3170180.1 hypothetical protein PC128_g18976 [Phytophthora cactorum]
MRAWIGADLAALPQTSGGMAVPDLRTELIAMTGSTVARWALLGTHGPHIVQIRDVHHWCGDDRGRLECMMLFPHNRRARLPLEQVQQYLTVLVSLAQAAAVPWCFAWAPISPVSTSSGWVACCMDLHR